jgi:hypothetical protein
LINAEYQRQILSLTTERNKQLAFVEKLVFGICQALHIFALSICMSVLVSPYISWIPILPSLILHFVSSILCPPSFQCRTISLGYLDSDTLLQVTQSNPETLIWETYFPPLCKMIYFFDWCFFFLNWLLVATIIGYYLFTFRKKFDPAVKRFLCQESQWEVFNTQLIHNRFEKELVGVQQKQIQLMGLNIEKQAVETKLKKLELELKYKKNK